MMTNTIRKKTSPLRPPAPGFVALHLSPRLGSYLHHC